MRKLIPYIVTSVIAVLLNIPHTPTNDYVAIIIGAIQGFIIVITIFAFILDVKIDHQGSSMTLRAKIHAILMIAVFLASDQTTLAILYTIVILLLRAYVLTQTKGNKNDG